VTVWTVKITARYEEDRTDFTGIIDKRIFLKTAKNHQPFDASAT